MKCRLGYALVVGNIRLLLGLLRFRMDSLCVVKYTDHDSKKLIGFSVFISKIRPRMSEVNDLFLKGNQNQVRWQYHHFNLANQF
jgi:hypothetical protein